MATEGTEIILQALTNYLIMMRKDVWQRIIGDVPDLLSEHDVHYLEGLCPALSADDRDVVMAKMRRRELFSAVDDGNRREEIQKRLLDVKRVIPSMFTMVRDMRHLEIGVKLLKQLLPAHPSGTMTLSERFAKLHNRQEFNVIQTCEFVAEKTSLEIRPAASAAQAHWVAYRMFWLLVLRHFPYMSEVKPRINSRQGAVWETRWEPRWWVDLCDLVELNGYGGICPPFRDHVETTKRLIEVFIEQDSPEKYYHRQDQKSAAVNAIKAITRHERKYRTSAILLPKITEDGHLTARKISDKCSIPRGSDHKENRDYLFFDTIYAKYSHCVGDHLTSFAYFRDFFIGFFGRDFDFTSHAERLPEQLGSAPLDIIEPARSVERPDMVHAEPESPEFPHDSHVRNAIKLQHIAPTENNVVQDVRTSARKRRSFSSTSSGFQSPISQSEALDFLFPSEQQNKFTLFRQEGRHFRRKQIARHKDALARSLKSNRYMVAEKSSKRLKLARTPNVLIAAVNGDVDAAIEQPGQAEQIHELLYAVESTR